MELSKVLFTHHPKLLNCDVETSAKAAIEISDLLGCILATVLAKQPHNFERAIQACMGRVIESAGKTADKAANMQPYPPQ